MQVGVRQLRAELTAMLRKVKGGEEIVITEHGRPVARLAPLELSEMVRRLRENKAVITPAKRRGGGRLEMSDLIKASGSVSDFVAEQRR